MTPLGQVTIVTLSVMLCGAADPELVPAGSAARGSAGLVASAHPEASLAGARMLRAGGNAMDAAVAVAYALGVTQPYDAGVGGGGFLLWWDAKAKKATIVDYREVAPKKAHRDMYLRDGKADPNLSRKGILAVGVPGMVPGLAEAQRRFGKKTLAESIDDAIRLARDGFEVRPKLARAMQSKVDLLRENPEAARVFLKDGAPYKPGETLKLTDLAKTLTRLKTEGDALFTTGAVGQAIAAESQRLGGMLAAEDLAGFEARIRAPLEGRYRGYRVVTMPPPSSGGTHILQMLGMLELDRKVRGRAGHWLDTQGLHVLVESMRLAYADRAEHLGDPGFHPVPLDQLLSSDYLAERYRAIDLQAARPSSKVSTGVAPPKEPPQTTHFTVIDRDGNVACITQTVNSGFGAGVVVPGTGVLLNNEMDDFAAAPGAPNIYGLVGGEANSVQPGKIPLSSMSPTIVLNPDDTLRLALGSPGGSTIITTVLQAILQVIDHGLDVSSAINSPRLHHQWLPDKLFAEPGALDPKMRAKLEAMGHHVELDGDTWGDASAIEVLPDGTRVGATDPRGDGAVAIE